MYKTYRLEEDNYIFLGSFNSLGAAQDSLSGLAGIYRIECEDKFGSSIIEY